MASNVAFAISSFGGGSGKVNGGGPELYLESSGGDIRIRTN